MRYRAALAIVLAVSVLAPASPAVAGNRGKDRRLQKVAHERINTLRAENGVRKLRRSRSLSRSASAYAGHMLRSGFFGHRPRIQASASYRVLGEVILKHQGRHGRPRAAVNSWARSGGHRSVLLGQRYRQIGVGKASGWFRGYPVTIWVAHIGRK